MMKPTSTIDNSAPTKYSVPAVLKESTLRRVAIVPYARLMNSEDMTRKTQITTRAPMTPRIVPTPAVTLILFVRLGEDGKTGRKNHE